jgi:aspartyl/glutamyl-tRNA(Asn/Gln) amidotransferase C subunit
MDWSKLVKHVSDLALVDLQEGEVEPLIRDLEKIVRMINAVNELKISDDVEPLYTTFFGDVNLRDDVEVGEPTNIKDVCAVKERIEGGYIRSPRTL